MLPRLIIGRCLLGRVEMPTTQVWDYCLVDDDRANNKGDNSSYADDAD